MVLTSLGRSCGDADDDDGDDESASNELLAPTNFGLVVVTQLGDDSGELGPVSFVCDVIEELLVLFRLVFVVVVVVVVMVELRRP